MTKVDLVHERGHHRGTFYRVTENERTLGSFAALKDAIAFCEGSNRSLSIVQVDHYEHEKTEAIIMIAKPLPEDGRTIIT